MEQAFGRLAGMVGVAVAAAFWEKCRKLLKLFWKQKNAL